MDTSFPSVWNITEKTLIDLIPEIESLQSYEETNAWHDHDNEFVHSMTVLQMVKKNFNNPPVNAPEYKQQLKEYLSGRIGSLKRIEILLWAAVFHDIGKPGLFITTEVGTMAPGHEEKSYELTKGIIPIFQFSEVESNRLLRLILFHGLGHAVTGMQNVYDRTQEVQKWITGPNHDITIDLLFFSCCDMQGSQLSTLNNDEFSRRMDIYNALFTEFV